jgi:hypothetical protein
MIMKRTTLTLTLIAALLMTLLLAASIPSLKVDSEAPQVQWSKTYGEPGSAEVAYSVVQTTDGGYAIAGEKREQGVSLSAYCWLVKTDADGNMQWNKTYGGTIYQGATSVIQTTDGGYAIAGHQVISDPFVDAFWLVKTDSTGETQWNKTYGSGPTYGGGQCMVQTSDGGYAIASTGLLIKTDSKGNIRWSQNYPGIRNVLETRDKGFAMTGITYADADFYIWLAKADSAGNMQWNRTYPNGAVKEAAYSFVQTSDGGFAVAGDIFFSGSVWSDILFFKTDSAGNLQWGKIWGNRLADWAASMLQTTDGGYAIECFTTYADFTLLKIDSNGNQQWSKKYTGYSGPNYPHCVIQTSDGGYALAGNGHPPIVNAPEDFWLIKTDSGGNSPVSSDIGVSITGSLPSPSPSPSPSSSSSPEHSPSPSASPTQEPTTSPSPSPTPTTKPVTGFLGTNLPIEYGYLLIAAIIAVPVIGIVLLVWFKKRKRQ